MRNKDNYLKKHRRQKIALIFIAVWLKTSFNQQITNSISLIHSPFKFLERSWKIFLISLENTPREVELILYYASDEYQYFLEHRTAFTLKQEITLPNYKRDHRERFLIYQLSY